MMVADNLQVPENCPLKWVVDCKNVGNGDKAIIYLGKYLYKGVIQEKDILKCEKGMVTFRYIHSKSKRVQTRTVPGEYFLWLLIQHVLPKGFCRARNYGLPHPCSKQLIRLLQYLLKINPVNFLKKLKQRSEIICQGCGAKMVIICNMIPGNRIERGSNSTRSREGYALCKL